MCKSCLLFFFNYYPCAQTKHMKPSGFEPWSAQLRLPNVPTRPIWLPQMKTRLCTEYIFNKIWIAHPWPGNLRGDKTVYITTLEHLIKYLDVVWASEALRIAILLKKSCLSSIRLTIWAAKFRLSRILRQPARFKRNLLNTNCSTTLHCGGFD